MTDSERTAIQRAYLDGEALEDIARITGVSAREADTYLLWWCDRACPGAERDSEGRYRLI